MPSMIQIAALSFIALAALGRTASMAAPAHDVQPSVQRVPPAVAGIPGPNGLSEPLPVPGPASYQTPYTACRSAHSEDLDAGNNCDLNGAYRLKP